MASSSECPSDLVARIAYLHSLGLTHKELHLCLERCSVFLRSFSQKDLLNWVQWTQTSPLPKLLDLLGEKKYLRVINRFKEYDFNQWENEFNSVQIAWEYTYWVLYESESFPKCLRNIHNPPAILYAIWKLNPWALPISVVWSRECSLPWELITRTFIRGFRWKGVSIISGGALGIDTIAHNAALEFWLHTVAILGSSLDYLYPRSNERLFETMVEKWGAIVSHFPINTPAAQYTFPVRNELIAGWSVGTLVTEARERSGSLITAQLALDMGRLIFAVPTDPSRVNARGWNMLLRDSGAKCVLSSDDVYSECRAAGELSWFPGESLSPGTEKSNQVSLELKCLQIAEKKGEDSNRSIESRIIQCIQEKPSSLEQISEISKVDISELRIPLGKMEITGIIRRDAFWFYQSASAL